MFGVAIMRILTVGLLLPLLGIVCQTNGASIPSFQKEKVYVYDYEGRVATGISEDDVKHFSGFGMKSHLKVYTKDGKVYFKFEDTKVGRVNTKVDDFFAPLYIEYTVAEDPVVKETVEHIEKPFAAIYEDGVFKSYYDPKDSMSNWRKAIIGIFQTQFHPTEAQSPNFYKTYEDGVGGKCKTLYKIAQVPSDDTHVEEFMKVTKVRLYDECETRPHYFFSSLDGYKCSHCKQENINPLKTFGRVQYEIRGDKQQFTIEKVYASGAISFTPFTTYGQTVLSVVNQTLDLVSETEDATPYEVDIKDYKQYETLAFHFYPETVENIHEIKNYHYNRIYKKPDQNNPVEELLPKLTTLAKAYEEFRKASQTIMEIIHYLQKFEYNHFVELFEKHVHSGNQETKEKNIIKFVLYRVLPYVGTNGAIKYMLELIESHKVDKNTANEMVSKFPFYVKEFCPEIMEMMEKFLKKEEVKNYLSTWNTGILAYGTLIHKACVANHMHPHSHDHIHFDKHPELCTKYMKELKEKFYSELSKNPKDASVYLKALINTVHPEAYEVLMKVARDDKYPALLRRNAMWGLTHYAGEKSEEIASILVPLFFDHKNDYVLRIYAFIMLLYTHPTPEFFSNLILSLETEPNEKVASYIFSTLATTANTTDPCHLYIGEKAKYVLQFVKPKQDYDIFRHSTNRLFSAYNAKYKFGRTSQFVMVPSEHSIVPREVYTRQSFVLLGHNFDLIEIGFTSDEDSVLSHLADVFGPVGIRKDHDREHSDHIKDIVSKLHLDKSRDHDDDARYEMYVKMFGHDLKMTQKYEVDQSNEIVIEKDKMVYDSHCVTYTEVEYIIPNEMGFPVVLALKVPVAIHVDGSAKMTPHQSEGVAVNFDVNAHVGYDFTLKAKMYVYTPTFRKYGYQLKISGGIQFPIKGSLEFDTHTKKFAVKYVPSTEAYEMLHYDTTPMAIFPEEPYYYPIAYSEHPVHREYNFGRDYFGVGLKYSFEYDYMWNDYGSYRDFFKSLFHKYTRYEDYFYLVDKFYAGTGGFLDYAVINPTAKPFHFHVTFEPSKMHPTTEFILTHNYNHSRYFEQDKGHDTCKVSASVVARGPVERRWNALFSVSKSYPEEDFRKVMFHYERTPIPNYDEKKFELYYKSNVTYVNYMTIFTDKPEEVSVKYNGKLTFGNEEDSAPKEIYVKMLAEQTEEHKNADKSKVSFYKKCKEDVEKKAQFTDACWKVMKDAGLLDKLTFDFELKNIPNEFKGFAYRLYSWFRHTYYNNLFIDYFHGSGEENHINVVANFSYHYPVFDVKITRPDHTVHYNKIYAPSVFPKYEPFTIAEDGKERFMRKFFSYQQPRCFVTGNRVHTFDGVDYPFDKDENKDYHLAMGDCENHHFFAFVKKLDNPKMDKAVKYYFHDDVFEVVPKDNGEELELFVNKKKEGTHGFIHHITHHPNYKLTVSHWGKGIYIESKDYGVHLYTDGRNTCFHANNFYRGKQCGLCGDLDGETHHEYKKPDGTPITQAEMNQLYRYHTDSTE